MKKLALALLLGFGFTITQAVAQEDEEIEYVEEYEEVEDDEAIDEIDEDEIAESTQESTNDSATNSTANTPAPTANAKKQAPLEPLDDEFADEVIDEGDEVEYADESTDESDEYADESSDESSDYNATLDDEGGSDITRWIYSEQEIARKEEIRRRQAEREAEYAKSLQRRRSGIFFGGGMGFSNMNLNDLGGSIAAAALGGGELSIAGIGVGAFAGYQQAFNEYSGIRAYGEFDYNLGNGIFTGSIGDGNDRETYKADNTLWKALGNIDFYLEGSMGRNQTETLGFFFGLGAGYIYYKGGEVKENGQTVNYKSLHLIAMTVNWGLHTILGTHHRLELFVRNYPFIKAQTGANGTKEFTSNIDAWLRYSYMF